MAGIGVYNRWNILRCSPANKCTDTDSHSDCTQLAAAKSDFDRKLMTQTARRTMSLVYTIILRQQRLYEKQQ